MNGIVRRLQALHGRGVLGMNSRNARFVLPYNPREHYPRVDDKVLTKQLARAAGIPAPEMLGVVTYHHQLRQVPALLDQLCHFVLKPARGAQGNGILVITDAEPGRYRKSSGRALGIVRVRQHISSIISGVFSLRGDWDTCLIEALVILDPVFAPITWQGIPDIRVIVFRGIPVMAMCRLPTKTSDGRANLHQGAIGVGLDMATGRAIHATYLNRSISHHTDTHEPIIGFTVSAWNDVLALAARAADMSGLGYLGVDIVMDKNLGPLLLELNARPGLAIQLANDDGLLPRLHRAAAVAESALTQWEDRCQLARELFSSD